MSRYLLEISGKIPKSLITQIRDGLHGYDTHRGMMEICVIIFEICVIKRACGGSWRSLLDFLVEKHYERPWFSIPPLQLQGLVPFPTDMRKRYTHSFSKTSLKSHSGLNFRNGPFWKAWFSSSLKDFQILSGTRRNKRSGSIRLKDSTRRLFGSTDGLKREP